MTCLRARLFLFILFTIAILTCSRLFSQTKQDYDYRDAEKFFNEEKWDDALSAFSYLAEKNVYNGYYWANYGYCEYMKKDYDKAIECFKKQIDVGFGVSGAMYNIACCYSLMQNPGDAIKWINKTAEYKYSNLEQSIINDKDFDPIRNTDVFKKEVMPTPDMFKNRIDGWKTDIGFFKKRMEETHFNLFANITKDQWQNMVNNLSQNAGTLDDAQIVTELYKITAKVGDGHTTVFPSESGIVNSHILPIRLWLFEDGLYIISAAPEYGNLAGKKVLKIGNYDISDVMHKLKEVISTDNEFTLKSRIPAFLIYTDILYGLGICPKQDEEVITVDDGQYTVKSTPFKREYMHSVMEEPGYYASRDTTHTPLYLKDLHNFYWFTYVPENKLVYMQYNSIQEKKDEPLKDFVNKIFGFINNNDVNYFVLDIRLNGGGNSFLNKTLVQGIVKCEKINKNGSFFVITGRNTFSAAMNLTGDLEKSTNVIFAGEPTGSRPNFTGESNIINLPFSGLRVSCSSRYWQNYLSDDYRKWIAPQLGVKYFYDDYKNGIDPAMNEIIKFINK